MSETDARDTELEPLERADRRLADRSRHTLAPAGRNATSLVALGRRARRAGVEGEALAAFAAGLSELSEAIAEHFPDNLLWDLDAVAGELCRGALAREDANDWLDAKVRRLVGLHELYGRHSPIRFSYVHDFIYGFDWAKWVARAPDRRGDVRPYDEAFLDYSEKRGRELLDLIARDDETYPELRHARRRNPFGFSREPEPELALHRDLARRGMIPIEAWSWSIEPVWDRPYAELRRRRAADLGLALD